MIVVGLLLRQVLLLQSFINHKFLNYTVCHMCKVNQLINHYNSFLPLFFLWRIPIENLLHILKHSQTNVHCHFLKDASIKCDSHWLQNQGWMNKLLHGYVVLFNDLNKQTISHTFVWWLFMSVENIIKVSAWILRGQFRWKQCNLDRKIKWKCHKLMWTFYAFFMYIHKIV